MHSGVPVLRMDHHDDEHVVPPPAATSSSSCIVDSEDEVVDLSSLAPSLLPTFKCATARDPTSLEALVTRLLNEYGPGSYSFYKIHHYSKFSFLTFGVCYL